ncbi:GNAT family N-acetyltransferase [Aquimarina sp. 2201CG5-10]|uniref:GNAT family N-acetyltransferase n=1 Tax=Aquimarina callyspongiae TaxID=3098150 RepID=UPI002AB40BA5|nr:GNAT family N-acetyltransferase [Aquimarina sp. 2201CG5-10]MDY8136231.1 GNAT family N-acetyltransferase [Aquimarina sp. 2201CG5-10]
MLEVKKYTELSKHTIEELKFYINNEFGHIPIVIETEWAIPDWTIIYYENEQIATFYNIVLREILIDNKKYKTAGINNVITPKEFRGKGYASKALSTTEYLIFKDLKCDLGVLLCADDLIAFYQRLNWYKVNCPVYFKQSSGERLWKANTMFLSTSKKINPKEINLNGLPW